MAKAASVVKGENRREIILKAAASLFFEQGYAATSIDAIIERVGGSKRNIYSEFGNKEGLFKALVAGCSQEMATAINLPSMADKPLQTVLESLGRRMLSLYMSPTMLGIYRTTLMEAHRFPDWAQTFYDEGPKQAIDQLAVLLQEASSSTALREIDYQLAAGHFIGMLKDNQYYQVVLGLRPPMSEAEIADFVRSIVDLFLHGALR